MGNWVLNNGDLAKRSNGGFMRKVEGRKVSVERVMDGGNCLR